MSVEQLNSKTKENTNSETSINVMANQENKKNTKLRELLKEHLTNEMFSAVQEVFYSPHLLIKCFLFLFLIIAYVLASFTTIKLILSYFD
jgi:hypothetical protein